MSLPNGLINFGPDANCTLSLCPIEASVYQYRPSLPVNIVFLVIFAIAMLVHGYIGYRWKNYWFMICMFCGCVFEIVGYAGRIILYQTPFNFGGFLVQIIFITCAPVFFTAAIYVTLSQTINALGPEVSRIKPALFYWIFIPADVVCLVLQAAGGAISTTSSGSSSVGIDVSMAGLILQVIILAIFSVMFGDYMIRRSRRSGATQPLNNRLKIFFSALSLAIALILGRCIYRCYELSEGYEDSSLISDEGLFIALEGVLIVLATAALFVGHPGFVFTPTGGIKGAGAPTRPVVDEESNSSMQQESKPDSAASV